MIEVVAGILRDARGRILLSQRLPGKHLAGSWEFPGGKLESGEAAADGLRRELAEELGIVVEICRPLLSLTHHYPEKCVRLRLLEVPSWAGQPTGREGQSLRWVTLDEASRLAMPAADRPILKALALDGRYFISRNPGSYPGNHASRRSFLADWQKALADGSRLLQLRIRGMDPESLLRLGQACGELARAASARWILNGPPELAMETRADGVHLTSDALMALSSRPLPEDRLVIASCHDPVELTRAGEIGADFVTLSPLRATDSHPRARPLGWKAFSDLCALSPLPVFALGGVRPDDLEAVRDHGGFGVAGINAFHS